MSKGLGHFLKDDRGMVITHKKWILHCVMTVDSMEMKMLTTVTYQLEWLKLEWEIMPNTDKDKGSWNSHTLLVGVWKCTILENCLIIYKVKYTPLLWSSNSFPKSYSRETKSFLYKKTCTIRFLEALFIITKNWQKNQYSQAMC